MTASAREAFEALAAGRLSAWAGWPDATTRRDLEEVFGPSEPGPDGVAMLAGDVLGFRDYPIRLPLAPHGVTIWFAADVPVALRAVQPHLVEGEIDSLGPPGVKEPSAVAPVHDQLAWPMRGITLHRHRYTGAVLHLYAYTAVNPDEYRRSWLFQVAYQRHQQVD